MHRRGNALNNVTWWERCVTRVGLPCPTKQSERQRPKPVHPTQPHDPALVSPRLPLRRFLGAGAGPYGASAIITCRAASRTSCTTCLAGDWRPLTSDTVSQRPRGCLMRTSEHSCRFAMSAALKPTKFERENWPTPTLGML